MKLSPLTQQDIDHASDRRIAAIIIAGLAILVAFFLWAFCNIANTAIHGNSTAPGAYSGGQSDTQEGQ